MLYYIKTLYKRLSRNNSGHKAWFIGDDENEHEGFRDEIYVEKYIKNKLHIWDMSMNPYCLCCKTPVLWNFNQEWN